MRRNPCPQTSMAMIYFRSLYPKGIFEDSVVLGMDSRGLPCERVRGLSQIKGLSQT
jgi:hypothetical protein